MSDITLSNFTDILDPDMIDKGRAFLAAGKFKDVKNGSENSWTAHFEEKKQVLEVKIELQRKEVSQIQCACANHDPEGWEEDPCVHAIALLFAMKNGVPEKKAKVAKSKADPSEKAKKALEKPGPKRKKTPEMEMLDGLEAPELKAFMQEMFTQSKEFKSQFMLYFSKNSADSSEQYLNLITQTISAIKGRRKYLPPVDAAKIATALTPLYKKAVEAETKGFFSETLSIIQPILEKCSEIYENIEGNSAKFNTFLVNSYGLRSQLVKNPDTPFSLKEKIFEVLLKEYTASMHNPAIHKEVYDNLLETCRVLKRVDALASLVEKEIAQMGRTTSSSFWGEHPRSKLVRRLVYLYETELQQPNQAERVLKANKDLLSVMLILIQDKITKKSGQEALEYIKEIGKMPKLYRNQYEMQGRTENLLYSMEMQAHALNGDPSAVVTSALKLFAASQYREMEYFKMAKDNTPNAADWKRKVDALLQEILYKKSYFQMHAAEGLKILEHEGRLEELRNFIFKDENPIKYLASEAGMIVWEHFPEQFWEKLRNLAEQPRHIEQYANLWGRLLAYLRQNPECRSELLLFIQKYLLPRVQSGSQLSHVLRTVGL